MSAERKRVWSFCSKQPGLRKLLLAVATALCLSTPAHASLEKVDHIIVIVEQNHTFDSLFGAYPGVKGLADVEQFPEVPGRRLRPLLYNHGIYERLRSRKRVEYLANHEAAATDAYAEGSMGGFGRAQQERGRSPDLAMLYHDRTTARGLWMLADSHVLFDNYFSAARGGSLANMLHLIAGRRFDIKASKRGLAALSRLEAPTIFDRLNENGVAWKYYVARLDRIDQDAVRRGAYGRSGEATPPQLYWAPVTGMNRFWSEPELRQGLATQDDFYRDAAIGELPSVSFVLPSPTDHPPNPPLRAHARLLGLVNAVKKGPHWRRTAIFVTWDDWGGHYDHVPPPRGRGFRVPALLISPFAKQGYVSSVEHDHTSLTKVIVDRFGLRPLSPRQASANTFEDAFDFEGKPADGALHRLVEIDSVPLGTRTQNRATLAMYVSSLLVAVMVVGGLIARRRQPRR